MSRENQRSNIKMVTAAAAALLLAAAFSVPAGTDMSGHGFGNAIVASAETTDDGFVYSVDGDSVTITGYTGSNKTVVIPSTIDGKTVTTIGNNAFLSHLGIESIIVPEGVTALETEAFSFCRDLKNITLPESLESIGTSAFYWCTNLKNITLPEGVTAIGSNAFLHCLELKNINFPNNVTSIGDAAFQDCIELASVSFGNDPQITTIGSAAFYNCSSLTSITLPDSVETIGDGAFAQCSDLTSITIPNSVETIGDGAFTYCTSLTSITIPNSVGSIEKYTFENCTSLESIAIPNSVGSIGENAFLGCTGLKTIFLPKAASIVTDAIPASVTQAKYIVDDDGNVTITEVTLGSGQTSVAIPDTIDGKPVTSIGEGAFSGCENLESVTFGDDSKLNSIGYAAFNLCTSLKSIVIPDSVTSINEQAFNRCELLESVTFGDDSKLNSIDIFAFRFCKKLKSMIIPAGVTSLGSSIFIDCSSLDSVFYPAGPDIISATENSVSRICYSVSDNKAVISAVQLGWNKTDVVFPSTISGLTVYLGDDSLAECPKVSHTHREKTAATCTNKSVCAICGQEYGEIDPDNHSFTNYVSNNDATCTKNGTETATCDNGCDKTDTREIADSALGHDNSGAWQKNDTEHWKVCTRNDCEEILDKANHDYDDGKITTKPTEETEGVKTFTCKTCGYEKTEPIAKLNHTHKTSEEYSKDETGHWHDCSGCDEKIDFESHDFDEGVVTTEPTDKTEGVKTFTCKDCGYEKTETIPVTKPSIPETPAEKVNSFVERLYENVLGRHSDPSKETHIDNLTNGETATKVAYDFVFSSEFTNLDISNEERVRIMYLTFLNREPDPAGLETWTKALDNGCSIGHIFYGFTQSGEFGDICKEYGIEQGTWEYTENRDKSAELTAFVSRLYTHVLNRKFDVNGLNDHTGNYLENHDLYQMAYNFIFSPEFIEKELSDEEFVDTMYRTFFDREADPDGKADWLDRMANQGYTREDVLAGFVGSQECADLVAKFGI